MLYRLQAMGGRQHDEGVISIHINRAYDGSNETFAWEWQGKTINTGDTFEWRYISNAYAITLNYAGSFFGRLTCQGWHIPNNPNNEPSRPWFRRTGNSFNSGDGYRNQSVGRPSDVPVFFMWYLI